MRSSAAPLRRHPRFSRPASLFCASDCNRHFLGFRGVEREMEATEWPPNHWRRNATKVLSGLRESPSWFWAQNDVLYVFSANQNSVLYNGSVTK